MRLLCLMLFFVGLLSGPVLSQVEPQFKFYLAFEDAKQERDTVWFGIDENASTIGFDSVFGDTLIFCDSTVFNLSLGGFGDSNNRCRKIVINGNDQSSWSRLIYAENHQLPITIRWDTNLLTNHALPFELKQAWLSNDNYLILYDIVNLFQTGLAILPDFIVGGGFGEHFPLDLYFSKDSPPNTIGIEGSTNAQVSVYPVPSSSELWIERLDNQMCSYILIDLLGRILQEGRIENYPSRLDISHLSAGKYTLVLSDTKTTNYAPVIIFK